MKTNVDSIVKEVLNTLFFSVERLGKASNCKINSSKSVFDKSGSQKTDLNETDLLNVKQKNISFAQNSSPRKGEAVNFCDCDDVTDTSSGFEDLFISKATDMDCLEDSFQNHESLNLNNNVTKTSAEKNINENDEKFALKTSTPKKYSYSQNFKNNSSDHHLILNSKHISFNKSFEKSEINEYLNKTIDDAIKNYEKEPLEIKFKEVYVQTTFEAYSELCNCRFKKHKQNDDSSSISDNNATKKIKIQEDLLTAESTKISNTVTKPTTSGENSIKNENQNNNKSM